MNILEKQMVDILLKGIDRGSYLGVKAEFEAEGTRIDELLRLVDVARKAQAKVTVKIGGCEALRDLFEAKQLGVDFVVAPMVETPYALSKYAKAIEKSFKSEDRTDVDFLFNLETFQTFLNVDSLVEVAVNTSIKGVVFGRNDFAGSIGLTPDQVESEKILDSVRAVAEKCKVNSLDLVVGGAVSTASVPFLRNIYEVHLDRFETRKVVFKAEALTKENLQEDLLEAVKFEMLWLKNKKNYYSAISVEDDIRFETLNKRWGLL
jgi:hypothetical protein